jgi:multiple antibiotic resistance protein
MNLGEQANLLISVLALTNPIGNLPLFLAITATESLAARRRIAVVSGVSAFVTLVVAYWLGLPALAAFGISLEAFVLGAGLIVLLYGLAMVRAPEALLPSRDGEPSALERRSPAVVPLAIPLLVGPGTIAVVLLHRYAHRTVEHGLIASLVMLLAAVLITLTLFFADRLNRWVGPAGISALSRILGMLVMAIGFMGITSALRSLWPALGG